MSTLQAIDVANALPLEAERPPLRIDPGGVVRIGSTRVSLDLIVEQYENGMTPEDMVRAYDTLAFADVYTVIGWYLRHREAVASYLRQRTEEADALRQRIESERPRITAEKMMSRAGETANVATGQ